MPDDAGYGSYACLVNPTMRTPSVDAFEKQSLLLTHFHVRSTTSACSPTRAALMSGRHEFKNGVTHTLLKRERQSRRNSSGRLTKIPKQRPTECTEHEGIAEISDLT